VYKCGGVMEQSFIVEQVRSSHNHIMMSSIRLRVGVRIVEHINFGHDEGDLTSLKGVRLPASQQFPGNKINLFL